MRHTIQNDTIDGTRVTVMGLGRFGGGAGVVRWLRARGARITVTDRRSEHDLATTLDALDTSGITLHLGEHRDEDFTSADVVVVNPAVPRPWENAHVRAAADAGAVITTEIRLALECVPQGVVSVGVTGSTGKSTTTSMIARALAGAWPGGRVHLGGNIGGSLLDRIDEIERGDALVVELSSAQLWWISRAPAWTPSIAMVTNLVANHIDWHGTFEHYESCKRAIAGDRLVCHAGPIEGWGGNATTRVVRSEAYDAFATGMTLPGVHNTQNAALALEGARWALELGGHASDGTHDQCIRAIAAFEGLEHRLREIGTANGVRFVDDSKCSTPEGAALALRAFEDQRVHLICGGADKGIDLAPMIEAAVVCASVLCIGATGAAICEGVRARGGNTTNTGTLIEAMARARTVSRPGDVILLSPGCASWDQFANYIERAADFRGCTERIFGELSVPKQK